MMFLQQYHPSPEKLRQRKVRHRRSGSQGSGQQQQGRAEAATQTQAEWSGEVCRCPGCPAPGGQEDFLDQLDRKVSPPS